jgi:hypothetical protein
MFPDCTSGEVKKEKETEGKSLEMYLAAFITKQLVVYRLS